MAKNVELLDNGNEILYPRTVTEQVAVTANQNLKEKLNEMDANIESVTNEVKDARTNGNTNITYNNLKARLDDEHKKTNIQLSHIVKPIYEIDVTNPPAVTGLLPYEFDGDISENTNRIQAIFDYVLRYQISFTSGSINTGYCYKVKFPSGVYEFDKPIYPKGLYLDIEGNRAILIGRHGGHVLHFKDKNGWNCNIKGLTFKDSVNAIWFDYYNLEMGNTTIEKCWFIDNSGEAIHINKQSQIALIKECKFHLNEYDLYFERVDRCIFEDNWVSIKGRSKNKDASIIAMSTKLIARNNLFVPRRDLAGVTETAYINANCTVKMIDNHFGGEPGARTIVNVLEGCRINTSSNGNPKGVIIEVSNSDSLFATIDYCAVRLFALPMNLIIKNSYGFVDNTVIAKWGQGVDESAEIKLCQDYCQIDIQMNNGYRIKNPGTLDLIPKNLKRFLYNPTKYTNNIEWNGDLAVYNNYAIFDTKIKKNLVGEEIHSYFMQVSFMPSNGMYRNVTFGVINFTTLYKDSKVVTQVHFTPIFDKTGGLTPGDSNEIKVVFQENDRDVIETNGAANPNNNLILKITTGKQVAGKFRVKIREFEDGATLRL